MKASRGTHWAPFSVLAVLLILVAGCSSDGSTSAAGTTETTATTASTTTEPATETTEAEPVETTEGTMAEDETDVAEFVDFDAASFSDPTTIDNNWFPLTPGNRLVLDGVTVENGESLDHRIEFIVTDLTKEIAGVETVVAWIEDYSDDELVEAELAFYAQDDDGTVWFLGEYPEEYEEGEFVAAPTWIAGIADARPGVKMYAQPETTIPAYFQGWGPEVGWSDYAQIEAIGEQTCVELDCYEDLVIIAESSLEEEGIFQIKSYAPGVGNVEVGFRGDDSTQEELGAISYGPVTADELAQYRTLAMEMEAHAYEVSPDVYGETAPIQ